MSWLFLAILGHLSNTVSFVVDKTLLTTALKRSATYAALIGAMSLLIIPLAPWVKAWPPLAIWPAILGFGFFYVFALWMFYEGLKRAETSRVVPIVGSLIPLFTLAGTSVFFQERLTMPQAIGFFLLLIATVILSRSGAKKSHMNSSTLAIVVLCALLFALTSLFGKYAFDHADFLGVLILSRIVAGLTGIAFVFFMPAVGAEVFRVLFPKRKERLPVWLTLLAFTGQILGAGGFILVHLAIAKGSASLVNAMQAVQYAAIVLLAWFGGSRLRALLREERTTAVIVVKTIAIVLVAIGLGLIAQQF